MKYTNRIFPIIAAIASAGGHNLIPAPRHPIPIVSARTKQHRRHISNLRKRARREHRNDK